MKQIKRHFTGFTLLEILVVLVILGLVSGLLLQGLSYTMLLREKIQKQLGSVQISQLQESWFRKSCESFILPQVEDLQADFDFAGSATQFEGTSLFSLDAPMGVTVRISWRLETIDGKTSLQYKGKDAQWWNVATWLSDQATFLYRDSNNQWHKEWPNKEFPAELPVGIALDLWNGEKEIIWYARLLGDKKALVNPLLDY